MSWVALVYINREENHYKYYSVEKIGNRFTGVVHYGRIGSQGVQHVYLSSEIQNKLDKKIRKGYVLFNDNADSPIVEDINDDDNIEEVSRMVRRTSPTIQTREEINEEENNRPEGNRNVEIRVDRTHIIPNVKKYKTDSKGYINNYRNDYNRHPFDDFISKLKVVPLSSLVRADLVPINPSSQEFKKGQEYFNRIPTSSQYNKPNEFVKLRGSAKPTFACIYEKKPTGLECIGIFGVNSRSVVCDFLALKSNARFRINLLKKIILNISNSTRTDILTFKLKNIQMRKDIKKIADYYIDDTDGFLKYRKVDLNHGISLPKGKPKRWIN